MLNNPKINTSSSFKTYQKFFNTNNFSTSKEKLYTNIPKNMPMYYNTKEAAAQKTPNLKSLAKKDSIGNCFFNIGNRLININYSEKQPVDTSENKLSNMKINNLSYGRYSQKIEVNQINKIKLETEADKNLENLNENLFLNVPYENNKDFKESIKRHNSITHRTSNLSSFRGMSSNKSNKLKEVNENHPKQNMLNLIEEKDKEIEKLKMKLIQMKTKMAFKPTTLSSDSRLNENFFNTNQKSLSTSNKNNQNSNFKFDVKSLAKNKVEVFSERSACTKNSNKQNNFINSNYNNSKNNNNANANLANRNSFSAKNFMEIFNNTKKYSYTINNLSKSTNFNPIKYTDVRSNSKINVNPKNFSSTFSNFFRKSNAKINENLNVHLNDKHANVKSSREIISASNLNINSNSNSNSFNKNLSINAQMNTYKDYESNSLNNNNNNKNYNNNNINNNSKKEPKFNSEKPFLKKQNNFENSNESHEITSNFSDFINLDKHINRNSRTIENYFNNERVKNKRSSQLEIRDVDYNEDDFKKSNILLNENSKKIKIKGKSISSLTAHSHFDIKSKLFKKSNSIQNDEFFMRSSSNIDADGESNIFEKLSDLKLRTQYVLSLYADSYFKKGNFN